MGSRGVTYNQWNLIDRAKTNSIGARQGQGSPCQSRKRQSWQVPSPMGRVKLRGCRGRRTPFHIRASFDSQLRECLTGDSRQDALVSGPLLVAGKAINSVAEPKQMRRCTGLNSGFEEIGACTCVLLEMCSRVPKDWILRPTHSRASHASSDLTCRPRGWWKIGAVLKQHGCDIFRGVDPIRVNDTAGRLYRCATMRRHASVDKRLMRENKTANLVCVVIGSALWFDKFGFI